jgi:hypothetical protein
MKNARVAALSIITGGGKWIEMTIPADPLYQHFLFTAERRFWRCVETAERSQICRRSRQLGPQNTLGKGYPEPRADAGAVEAKFRERLATIEGGKASATAAEVISSPGDKAHLLEGQAFDGLEKRPSAGRASSSNSENHSVT